MGILENDFIEDTTTSIFSKIYGNCEPIPNSRHLTSEDKQLLNTIDLSFKVEVIISTVNAEGNRYGIEVYNYLKLRRFELQLEGYQFGISVQNHRFDIIPQGENLIHVYVPIQE
jgi:hypothetical protein